MLHSLITTAETISERSHKQLFSISSGELGTSPDVLENRLLKNFDLAQTWGAILLIDEADVFLAQRSHKDIHRNAFVSVFLRNLDWYSGILLLTTNRHEEFDEAFQSRIHIQIPYVTADVGIRTAIWKNLLEGQDNATSNLDAHALGRIGKRYELNGRDIRNLLVLSLMLSKSDNIPLNEDTIERVYRLRQCSNQTDSI